MYYNMNDDKEKEVARMKVPDNIVQAADNMSKETRLSFRDCLDILMRTYLADGEVELSNTVERHSTAVRQPIAS
jgi:hypothetical protein